MNEKYKRLGSKFIYLIGSFIVFLLIRNYFNPPPKTKNYTVDNSYTIKEVPKARGLDTCSFNTKDLSNNEGIEMNLYAPCDWGIYDVNNGKNGVVQQLMKKVSDSLTVGLSLEIEKANHVISTDETSRLLTKNSLIAITKKQGKYISSSKVYISGYESGEVILKDIENSNCTYKIMYILFNRDCVIIVSYILSATSIKNGNDAFFNLYENQFRKLVQKTQIF